MHYYLIIILALIFWVALVFSFAWYYWMEVGAKTALFSRIQDIPGPQTVLVPGTAKYLRSGKTNRYFQARMETAAALYRAGKAKRFLISGDGHSLRGNETEDMRRSLVDLGVPPGSITLDEGGTRTWVTLVRCRDIFGLNQVLLVSQKFHLQRAIWIGRRLGMQVTGFSAGTVLGSGMTKMYLREHLARLKCLADLSVLGLSRILKKRR